MTKENELMRQIVKTVEAEAAAALQSQPADDQECGRHLRKTLDRLRTLLGMNERRPEP